MDALLVAVFVAAGLVLALAAWVAVLRRRLRENAQRLREAMSAKQSQSTRYGQITEQFAPFMQHWPWDPKRFKFVGDPIDGIQFTDAGIVFVEIKSARSRLSAVQRQVRDHVAAGRVAWQEIRIG